MFTIIALVVVALVAVKYHKNFKGATTKETITQALKVSATQARIDSIYATKRAAAHTARAAQYVDRKATTFTAK